MLTKFLSPRNDLAFKRIFGTEKNKDILIHFLNDIFGRTTNPIEEVWFLKTAQDPEIAAQRASTVDVMCEDTEKNRFIVEMQVDLEPGFEKRAQYYAARTYIDQRERQKKEKGKQVPAIDYQDLKEVTFLGITNFTLFKDKTGWLCHHVMLDTQTGERDLRDFSFSFLELPKFKKTKDQLKTLTEKWTYFFKHAEETTPEELPLIVGSDAIIERAYHELERFNWTKEELRAYDSIDMKRSADKAVLEGAIAKGKAEGKAEGLAEGIQKGNVEGIERVARQMRSMGLDLATIEQATELSKEALEQLFETGSA